MASSLAKLVFFTFFILFTFSDNLMSAKSSEQKSDKVKLNLYYESLCPGCQQFIKDDDFHYLGAIFKYDLNTITDLKFVPFGNAELSSDNKTVTCQHGEEECKLNALEACVINSVHDPRSQFEMIKCIENNTENWESSCLKGSGVEQSITECNNSDLSKKLILEYAKETINLNPPHEYVPWVTLNNKPVKDLGNLVAQICKAYKGKLPLPKKCSQVSVLMSAGKVSKLKFSYANGVVKN